MKVYLIKTPEYEIEYFKEVHELLDSFDGPLEFITSDFEFNTFEFPFLKKYREDFSFPAYEPHRKVSFNIERGDPLSWKELFTLCDYYRKAVNIKKEDFVVLLTKRKNALNWFSHYDNNLNSFVHTGDWEAYTKAPQRFPVAYQVAANIMRQLMKLKIDQIPNKHIHSEPIGCMNDFCQNKQQIILKLRTGDICVDCMAKMRDERIGDEVVNQVLGIFEAIRNQLLFKLGFTRNLNPKPINIDGGGNVIIGDKEIRLDFLPKTLLIFFLSHNEGVTLNDLQSHKKELLAIYKKIRPAGEESSIDDLVKPYHQAGTFSVNKSRLNKKLKSELGEPLANFYYLDGNRGEAFRINISPDYITVDIRY
jgi:hypothetical protein